MVATTEPVTTTNAMGLSTRSWWFSAFAVAAAALHLDVLRELYAFSRSDSSASHLMLVPLVSLALILLRKDEIFPGARTEWKSGGIVVALGLGLAVAGRLYAPLSGQAELSLLVSSLLVLWVGGFLLFFGWKALSAARFAVAFLAFTIPIPVTLLDGATEILKRGSSQAVAVLFTLTGTPYYREGFVFSIPGLSIEVADACSGIRSTIALLMTALLAGHMSLQRTWTRVLLVLVVFPISILKNGLRIVSLSLLAAYVDPAYLAGRLHTDGGIGFFLLALALLMPILALLRRWDSTGGFSRRPLPSL